ncbi:unnamed protein product [Caretta caretta]
MALGLCWEQRLGPYRVWTQTGARAMTLFCWFCFQTAMRENIVKQDDCSISGVVGPLRTKNSLIGLPPPQMPHGVVTV